MLLTIMDKYFKYICLILSCKDDSAKQWTICFFAEIVQFWGLFKQLIADCDCWFLNAFWKELFHCINTALCLITVYHLSANEQAEWTNQTVEIALCSLLVSHIMDFWDALLSEIEFNINTSSSEATGQTPFVILYDVEPTLTFASQTCTHPSSADDFINSHAQLQLQVEDTLAMTRACMSIYFDNNHQPVELSGHAYLWVVCKGHHGYTLSEQSALHLIWVGLFWIIEWVSSLAYCLDLSPCFRSIHSVISIIHLEPYISDDFHHLLSAGSDRILDSQQYWEVKEIVDACVHEDAHQLKVWWSHGEESWEDWDVLLQDCSQMIQQFDNNRRNLQCQCS